jgi:hypothetical protein
MLNCSVNARLFYLGTYPFLDCKEEQFYCFLFVNVRLKVFPLLKILLINPFETNFSGFVEINGVERRAHTPYCVELKEIMVFAGPVASILH